MGGGDFGGDMDFGGGFDFWDHIFSYTNSRINYKFTYLYLNIPYSSVGSYSTHGNTYKII